MNRTTLLLLLSAFAASAGAQQARDDTGGSAQLQAMVQQLTSDRTQLENENRDLKVSLDAANAELKTLRTTNAALERRAAQTEASLNETTAANTRNSQAAEQLRTRMEELIKQFRATAESLRQTELERNDLRTKLASSDGNLKQCGTANQKLFDTGNEVLDRFEQKGCWAKLREREPFTKNKRVQLQNLVDSYRWQLEDQQLPAGKAQQNTASTNP
jgi:chromosome segregation ATPase